MPQRSALTATAPVAKFVNGTVVRSPGLRGAVTQWVDTGGSARSTRLPAEEDSAPRWLKALQDLGVSELETLHFDVVRPPSGSGMRSAAQNDLVELEPSAPLAHGVQVVLYQDESGGLSWHYPDGFDPEARTNGASVRGGTSSRFTIPARTFAAQEAHDANRAPTHLRGPITKVGRKIFKVLFIPLLASVSENPIRSIAQWAEEKYLQHGIRRLTPDNYRQKTETGFSDWGSLAGKRSLLVIHGIFSSSHGMLGGYPQAEMAKLCAHYEGRVFALEQFTVTWSPEDNARFFLQSALNGLGPGAACEFDILCHSRGGIVSRVLAERGQQVVPGNPCQFKKVYFAGTPNAGSALGEADHMVDMLDAFTNLATALPDGPVAYGIEVLLALVKLGAYTSLTRLPGISMMDPEGYIKTVLNASTNRSPALYAAVTAHFEPNSRRDNGWMVQFGGRAAAKIFARDGATVENDIVVPTHGVWEANGHPSFPIRDRLIFDGKQHVHHTSLFHDKRTQEHIAQFLLAPTVAVTASRPALAPTYRSVERPSVDSAAGDEKPVTAPYPGDLAPVRREPKIDVAPTAPAGSPLPLHVSLEAHSEGSRAEPITLPAFRDDHPLLVQAHLNASGFDVEGPSVCALEIHPSRRPETEKVTFILIPRDPGAYPATRSARVDFWFEGAVVGTVSQRILITPPGYSAPTPTPASPSTTPLRVAPVRREPCDLIVFVEGEDEDGAPPYRLRVQSHIPGHEFAGRAAGTLRAPERGQSIGDYVREAMEPVLLRRPKPEHYEGAGHAKALGEWQAALQHTLLKVGEAVWDMLPERFTQLYWELRDAGAPLRSILVHTDEWGIPWELLVPKRMKAGKLVKEPPLGRSYIIGRWCPGLPTRPQPQHMEVNAMRIIAPHYRDSDLLPAAQEEATELKARFNRAERLQPSRASDVRALLDKDVPVSWLHVCCHGEFDPANADLSLLKFEDGTSLRAFEFDGTVLLANHAPFVFLNACHVGKSGAVVGRTGGFSAALLNAGCSGVLAPLWEVDDQRAKAFSLLLYDKLAAGISVGEALQELRAAHPDDPTFNAFAYHGDPWARINLRGL